MKALKFFIIAISIMLLASSCVKTCNCKTRVDGEVVLENTIELDEGQKCGDFNRAASALNHYASVKCTPILF